MTDAENTEMQTRQVQELLDYILHQLNFPGIDAVRHQAASVVVVRGPLTMLDLRVTGTVAASEFMEGPIPMSAVVTDSADAAVGELLIWLKDGYLNALEYAWWTDDQPDRLPNPEHVRVTRNSGNQQRF
jgi:hypothetical protein